MVSGRPNETIRRVASAASSNGIAAGEPTFQLLHDRMLGRQPLAENVIGLTSSSGCASIRAGRKPVPV